MSTMHYYHSYRPNPLEIKQLAEFDAALGDISDSEKRRRRIVYLRDAMQQIGVGKSFLKGFGIFVIPFVIIPLFWPFLAFFWFFRKKAGTLMDGQIVNALDYWGIERHEIDPNQFQR